MCYENPLYLAEEAAALDQIADGRGGDMAREKFYRFLEAIEGKGMATAAPEDQQYPLMVQPGSPLPISPHSEGLRQRIWWGAGSNYSAEQTARDGVNMMSSTLVFESGDRSFGEIQAEQIARYRAAWNRMEGSGTFVDSSRICFALDLSAADNSQPVGIPGKSVDHQQLRQICGT